MMCKNVFDGHAYNWFNVLKCMIPSIVMKIFYATVKPMLITIVISGKRKRIDINNLLTYYRRGGRRIHTWNDGLYDM